MDLDGNVDDNTRNRKAPNSLDTDEMRNEIVNKLRRDLKEKSII